jgi:tetratricopeptide (TPR) repeat protein
MQPEQGQNHTLDRPADMRAGAAPSDASAPRPASPAEAGALPAERRGRRRTAAQAAGRGWHVVLLVILGALVVAGLLAYDFLHLRRAADAPEPAMAGFAETSPAAAAPLAPSPALPQPAASQPPAQAHSETLGNSSLSAPAGSAGEIRAPRPSPEASRAESTNLLEQAQAAFDEGNLDRAQSEARRAAGLGNREADGLLGAIAFKRGHLAEAARLLSKALERDPGNSRIARQLQAVRAKQGR